METKKVAKAGLIAAAAGAGAYLMFSKRCAPTRQQWSTFLRDKLKGSPKPLKATA